MLSRATKETSQKKKNSGMLREFAGRLLKGADESEKKATFLFCRCSHSSSNSRSWNTALIAAAVVLIAALIAAESLIAAAVVLITALIAAAGTHRTKAYADVC